MTLEQILEEVSQYGTSWVTVTGGEPLAQSKCLDLLDMLLAKDYRVSLETSGALDISEVNRRVVKVMDLKTPSSGEERRNFYQNLDHLHENDQVKFVIGSIDDYLWAKTVMGRHHIDQRCQVLFSPVAGKIEPGRLAEAILQDRLPVRFQVQLHKILWGNEKGR